MFTKTSLSYLGRSAARLLLHVRHEWAKAKTNKWERVRESACKKPHSCTSTIERPSIFRVTCSTHNKMKCASNKTTQICTWWMAYSFIHTIVSIFAIWNSAKMYCQMAVISSSKLPWSEVFVCMCAHRSYHLHPSIVMGWIDGINKNKLLEIRPQVFGCRFSYLWPCCVLVAHMACSNKIMKFHTGEIEIEKSLFKTFMYAHWCDLIGTLSISSARFFNVLCLFCSVVFVFSLLC